MADEFQLALNILLSVYALFTSIIFSIVWRKRKDLLYWFLGLLLFTLGHIMLIFSQFNELFEYLGNGIQVVALLVVIISNFIEYLDLMIRKVKVYEKIKREKIILVITLVLSILAGVIVIITLLLLEMIDLLHVISILMIMLLIPLSIFNIRIYAKEKTITRLFMFFVFLSGVFTAIAVILSLYFEWGRAANIAMDFIFITLLLTAGVASPIEFRITQSESKYRELSEHLEEIVEKRTSELAQANKDLESFSYSVSHDLKAPLRSISGFADILHEELFEELSEKHKEHFLRIIKNTERMNNLINDLLSLGQITKLETENEIINISEMAKDIMETLVTFYPNKEIQYKVQDNLIIKCDKRLIRIMMENLLTNAVKFSSKKPNPKIIFGSKKENNKEVFYVKDNGVGFDMKYYNKLFGIFQRLHSTKEYEGTGIGLVTVKRIIDRQNGKIWAKSKLGEGTTFYFTFEEK